MQPTREEAAEIFLRMLIGRARDGVITDIVGNLREGPLGRKPPAEDVALQKWYSGLEEQDRSFLSSVITRSVDASLFGALVLLDGLTGGPPIGSEPSDFSLQLQTYSSEDSRRRNTPSSAVRINPAATTEALHDMYRWMLSNRNPEGKK